MIGTLVRTKVKAAWSNPLKAIGEYGRGEHVIPYDQSVPVLDRPSWGMVSIGNVGTVRAVHRWSGTVNLVVEWRDVLTGNDQDEPYSVLGEASVEPVRD